MQSAEDLVLQFLIKQPHGKAKYKVICNAIMQPFKDNGVSKKKRKLIFTEVIDNLLVDDKIFASGEKIHLKSDISENYVCVHKVSAIMSLKNLNMEHSLHRKRRLIESSGAIATPALTSEPSKLHTVDSILHQNILKLLHLQSGSSVSHKQLYKLTFQLCVHNNDIKHKSVAFDAAISELLTTNQITSNEQGYSILSMNESTSSTNDTEDVTAVSPQRKSKRVKFEAESPKAALISTNNHTSTSPSRKNSNLNSPPQHIAKFEPGGTSKIISQSSSSSSSSFLLLLLDKEWPIQLDIKLFESVAIFGTSHTSWLQIAGRVSSRKSPAACRERWNIIKHVNFAPIVLKKEKEIKCEVVSSATTTGSSNNNTNITNINISTDSTNNTLNSTPTSSSSINVNKRDGRSNRIYWSEEETLQLLSLLPYHSYSRGGMQMFDWQTIGTELNRDHKSCKNKYQMEAKRKSGRVIVGSAIVTNTSNANSIDNTINNTNNTTTETDTSGVEDSDNENEVNSYTSECSSTTSAEVEVDSDPFCEEEDEMILDRVSMLGNFNSERSECSVTTLALNDLWKVLGVELNRSEEEVQRRWRELVAE